MLKRILIVVLFTALGSAAFAQSSINTDRPDQTESSLTVPKGYFQIESGSMLEIEEDSRDWTMNTNLFRFGVTDFLELRLVNSISRITEGPGEEPSVSIDNIEFGAKIYLVKSWMDISLLSHAIIPSGGNEEASKVAYTNRLLLAHPVTDKIALGYNLGYNYFDKENSSISYTLSAAFSLTDKIGFFAEVYGDKLNKEDFSNRYDNGFTYLLKPNLQLDFSFGTGLDKKYNFYSLGFSWRKPK